MEGKRHSFGNQPTPVVGRRRASKVNVTYKLTQSRGPFLRAKLLRSPPRRAAKGPPPVFSAGDLWVPAVSPAVRVSVL